MSRCHSSRLKQPQKILTDATSKNKWVAPDFTGQVYLRRRVSFQRRGGAKNPLNTRDIFVTVDELRRLIQRNRFDSVADI